MAFPLITLPSELLVQIFGLLDFKSFISMKSTCQVAKNVGENNNGKNGKHHLSTFTFGSDENLKRYLSNLKVTKRLFIDEYNESYANHFNVGPLVENVEIVELSNIKKSISSSNILPLFKSLKKCNQFKLEGGRLVDGKLSILLEEMNFCFSLRLVFVFFIIGRD
uniref:F-box domain-containing protein n=1 Tax=Panagrolaimus sp. PS1159 TaxID=55785 RepID=A0AC35FR17_9BILA